jgi:NADH dehydrogenase
MKIAITGATGFAGRHLADALREEGHELVRVSRSVAGAGAVASDLSDAGVLEQAFLGCEAVAHLAGINREIGVQTYDRVHVRGTANVIAAAQAAGVKRIALLSFLRARPDCGSPYHESKWAAEELVRNSGLNYTILKAAMIYGKGDHMLDHLSHALHTFPLLAMVGMRAKTARPVAVQDVMRILAAAVGGKLQNKTVAVMGPEELLLEEIVARIERVIGVRRALVPAPIWFHRAMAMVLELAMKVPMVARAQVRILAEGVSEAWGSLDALPPELEPRLTLNDELIRAGLPQPGPFTVRDLRCCDLASATKAA